MNRVIDGQNVKIEYRWGERKFKPYGSTIRMRAAIENREAPRHPRKSPPKRAKVQSKARRTKLSRCRSVGIDGGLVRSNPHPAVFGLPDFSVLLPASAVDLHSVDGRRLAAGDRVSILPFSVCSFESSFY